MVSEPFESSMGSAMDEEAFIASVAQFLKKENEDRARHFEEQKLHSQYMKNQLMEMKELLLNMAKGQQEAASAPRSPTSPLNEQSESVDVYLGRFECAHQVFDEMPSDLNHDLAAHQLFDELLNPQNCIEHEPCVELSKYNGQGVFEIAGDLSQDLVDGDHGRSTEEVLEVDGDLSQVLVAHQVLDKMPRSSVSGELIFLDEIEKINEELVDGLNWKAPPMSSVKELDGVVCVICFDPGGLQQGYGPPPLPKPPAGFVVDDQGRVLMASSKRIVTVVDPTNNLPLECTIRRIFTISKGAECMLLCPVDMRVEIVKSTSDGWAAVTEEELVVCFIVWVFDPGGHLLMHATFGSLDAMGKMLGI